MPTQLTLEDVILNRSREHEELERVAKTISEAVVAFCWSRIGLQFHLSDLEEYAQAWAKRQAVGYTFGSAGRIMRSLKSEGTIQYDLVDRSKSLYAVRTVKLTQTINVERSDAF